MADAPDVQTQSRDVVVSLRFTGQADEYFRIWIVNVCLSVVTLGVYSAWAKVRRKKYFYGNTLLNDAAFDYLADPKAILKGRLIVFGLFVVYELLKNLGQIVGAGKHAPLYQLPSLLFGLVVFFMLPGLVIRALAFNARNSSHRNVRFRFAAGYPARVEARKLVIFILPLAWLTLGLLYPYYAYRKRTFVLEHTHYGTTPFSFDARPGAFYFVYAKVMLLFLIFLVGSVVTLGIGILPLYILFAAYRDAVVARLTWKHTALGNLRFDCNWKTWDLFKLHLVNSLGIIFTVGLLVPWAAIRAARYQLQGLSLRPAGEISGFVAAAQEPVAATGDAAVELLGFDFGL